MVFYENFSANNLQVYPESFLTGYVLFYVLFLHQRPSSTLPHAFTKIRICTHSLTAQCQTQEPRNQRFLLKKGLEREIKVPAACQ